MSNLAIIRAAHKITLSQLSERVEISKAVLGKIETGESLSSIKNGLVLADYFGLTLDDIYSNEVNLTFQPTP